MEKQEEKQETWPEVSNVPTAAIQAGDDSGVGQDGRDGGKEKWLDSEYV